MEGKLAISIRGRINFYQQKADLRPKGSAQIYTFSGGQKFSFGKVYSEH
jgi:hypothetical protein